MAVAGIVVKDRAVATRWIFTEHEHTMTVRLIMGRIITGKREKGEREGEQEAGMGGNAGKNGYSG